MVLMSCSLKNTIDIISIDPGTQGGMAHLRVDLLAGTISLLRVCSFKHDADWERTVALWCTAFKPDVAVLESVNAFGQGRSSAFTFGGAAKSAHTAMTLAGCRVATMRPQAWQTTIGMPHRYEIMDDAARKRARKKDERDYAIRFFPEAAGMAKRMVTNKKGKEKEVEADIFAAVLIGLAAALEMMKDHGRETGWFAAEETLRKVREVSAAVELCPR